MSNGLAICQKQCDSTRTKQLEQQHRPLMGARVRRAEQPRLSGGAPDALGARGGTQANSGFRLLYGLPPSSYMPQTSIGIEPTTSRRRKSLSSQRRLLRSKITRWPSSAPHRSM